ncbi:MAG: PH domain-containing protein [Propionibacteriaceae bacterium]|nr:PH domain-containing protein [Propionibacteriaceae bacterium]
MGTQHAGSAGQGSLVIRSDRGRVGTLVIAAMAAVIVVLQAWQGPVEVALRYAVVPALVVWVVYLMWSAASVRLDADGLTLRNPFVTRRLPWSLVTGAESRWGLVVEAGGRRWSAWAAPARGSYRQAARDAALPDLGLPPAGEETYIDLDARAAARLVRQESERRRPPQAAAQVTASVNVVEVGVLGLLAVGAALAILL